MFYFKIEKFENKNFKKVLEPCIVYNMKTKRILYVLLLNQCSFKRKKKPAIFFIYVNAFFEGGMGWSIKPCF